MLSESDVEVQEEKPSRTESKHVQFDIAACCNSGRPIDVEWDNKQRDFVDGFGLCSLAGGDRSRGGTGGHRAW